MKKAPSYWSSTIRKEMGNPNATVSELRDYLEENGINRHSMIVFPSFEAILVAYNGDIYGYRRIPEQKGGTKELSMFGGTIAGRVTATAVANVIMSKTPITGLHPAQISLYNQTKWSGKYEYPNGDKAFFRRHAAIVYINDEQKAELLQEKGFHEQILEVLPINDGEDELYDHQKEIFEFLLKELNK